MLSSFSFKIVLTPIEVAIEDVQKKIGELDAAIKQVDIIRYVILFEAKPLEHSIIHFIFDSVFA